VCSIPVLLRKNAYFGSFPLLGYMGAYRKLLSAFYGGLLFRVEPLSTICSLASALTTAIALGFSCGPVFSSASLASSVLPFLGHPLLQKEKPLGRGVRNQSLSVCLLENGAALIPQLVGLRGFLEPGVASR